MLVSSLQILLIDAMRQVTLAVPCRLSSFSSFADSTVHRVHLLVVVSPFEFLFPFLMCEVLGPSKFVRPFDVYDVYRSSHALLILGYRKREPDLCSLLEVNLDTDRRGIQLVGGEELLDRRKALRIIEAGSHDAHARLVRSRAAGVPAGTGTSSADPSTFLVWPASATRASSAPPNHVVLASANPKNGRGLPHYNGGGPTAAQRGHKNGGSSSSGAGSSSSSSSKTTVKTSLTKPKPLHTKLSGILGFYSFFRGYYVAFVSKKKKVGRLGHHDVYQVDQTQIVALFDDSSSGGRAAAEGEPWCQRLWQQLGKDFYWSYSYELSRSVQQNASDCFEAVDPLYTEGAKYFRFVWNKHLVHPYLTAKRGHRWWMLGVIQGCFDSSLVCSSGQHLEVCLIARRSTFFAGTRYRKRGIFFSGVFCLALVCCPLEQDHHDHTYLLNRVSRF